jgi:UPF0755 protein
VGLGVLALVIAIAGGAWAWVLGQVHSSPGGAPVTVVVRNGEGLSALAPTLSKDGVINSTLVFRTYLRAHGAPTIGAGTYVLARHEPYAQILSTLAKGPQLVRLVIPEGYSIAQIAAKVGQIPGHSASAFLAEARSGQVSSPYEPAGADNLEGLLFPATYTFPASTSDQAILQMMVNAFDQEAASINLAHGAANIGITPYQAVIVASLVVKEAKTPSDMGKVARVIYNRLAQGMALDIDATVVYANGGHPLTQDAKNVDPSSPYNTYNVMGLPPTPIASPGLQSLDAALYPTPGNWLYFVVVNQNGSEAFCQSYSCQLANEAKAQSEGIS